MGIFKIKKIDILFVMLATTSVFVSEVVYADAVSREQIESRRVDKVLPNQSRANKSKKVRKASKNIINQLRKEVNKKTPEAFSILLKNMESNYNFAFDLTHAIGSRNKSKVNELLSNATKTKMSIDYLDSGTDDILQFRICASINGTRRCFPSQRNSMDCPKF